jgi:tetratricopeptide (TPR) repeat protein
MGCYTKAIRINPNIATLYSKRALCEIQLSKFQLAREDAEDALELDPDQVKYYRILSEAVFKLELFKEASATCDAGLEIDPRDETLLLRQRDCKAMIADQEIKKNPVHGGDLSQLGNPKFMKEFFKTASDVLPEDVQPFKLSHIKINQELGQAHRVLLASKGIVQYYLFFSTI